MLPAKATQQGWAMATKVVVAAKEVMAVRATKAVMVTKEVVVTKAVMAVRATKAVRTRAEFSSFARLCAARKVVAPTNSGHILARGHVERLASWGLFAKKDGITTIG
jgi:hypothetical protein